MTAAGGRIRGLASTRKRKAGIALLLVLALATAGVAALVTPSEPEPSYSPDGEQVEIQETLEEGGYTAAVVDVDAERILVRYEPPEDTGVEESTFYVLTVAGEAETEATDIVLQVYQDGSQVQTARVSKQTVERYLAGELSYGELEQAVDRDTTDG